MVATHEPSDRIRSGRPAQPSADECREQMERILADPTFQASVRRRALLSYIVEETLADRGDRLKGYTIALAVFGRDDGFDAQADPVVRLEARRLRRDLDGYYAGAGSQDRLRLTIPKGGYVPHFEWVGRPPGTPPDPSPVMEDPAPDPAPPPDAPAAAPDESGAGQSGGRQGPLRRGLAAVAAIVVLLAVAAGTWLWVDPAGEGPAAGREPAIIVLPFEVLGPGDDDRHLAGGLTQDLITDLMRFAAFRLYSLPASFGQDPNADPLELGRSLEVAYVVKGNVRSSAGAVRVGVRLIDAANGRVLWSASYDRPLTAEALLAVQSELAREIAAKLGQAYGVVNSGVANRLSSGGSPGMPTYACLLRAHAYRRTFDAALYQPVRECLQAGVRRDPEHAPTWAMLGWMHLDAVRFDRAPAEQTDAESQRAFEAAGRALELDPSSVLALQALSSINYYAGRHAEAESLLRRALALNPNDPDTMAQLGWRLAARGEWDEGIGHLRRAIDRTVSPPGWYFHLIAVHACVEGDYRAMLAAAEQGKADGSGISYSLLAIAEAELGNPELARHALDEMAARAPRLDRNPAAVYRGHQLVEGTVESLVAGLRKAGWTERDVSRM